MKEAKFRFYYEPDNRMYYFTLGDVLFATKAHEKKIGLDKVKSYLELTSKNPDTDERVMWYSGFEDKNGREVYDKDIIYWDDDDRNVYSVIQWNEKEGCWGTECGLWLCNCNWRGHVKIVGNKLEHPELLKNGGK